MFLKNIFKRKKKVKALSLFSGGLDSMLAVKMLQEQGIQVEGICFVSNFFDKLKATDVAKQIGLKLRVVDVRKELLSLVKNPPSGHGKNLNPCVDCHSLMIRYAGEIAKNEGFDFVATGEVLGQRPFSQNKGALLKVKELAGVDVLRPLSAQLLPETEMEKKSLVNRKKLGNLEGRTRDGQKELIKKYKIKEYPSPAGGCVLTDGGFCSRLDNMLKYWPNCTVDDVELLKHGRVFWLKLKDKTVLLVIGRHKEDNDNLEKLAQNDDFMLKLKEVVGPSAILRFRGNRICERSGEMELDIPTELNTDDFKLRKCADCDELFYFVSLLTGYYSVRARGKKVLINIQ